MSAFKSADPHIGEDNDRSEKKAFIEGWRCSILVLGVEETDSFHRRTSQGYRRHG